jgi:nicotinamide mononucleotide (NMN) deamidase PncC
MARGVGVRLGADHGLATTGVAGPDPQDGHPVGEVHVATWDNTRPYLAPDGVTTVVTLTLPPTLDRATIRATTVAEALHQLATTLAT